MKTLAPLSFAFIVVAFSSMAIAQESDTAQDVSEGIYHFDLECDRKLIVVPGFRVNPNNIWWGKYNSYRKHRTDWNSVPFEWKHYQEPPNAVFTDAKVVELLEAALAEDLTKIDELVAKGADVNTVGKNGITPLIYTTWFDKPRSYKRLLELKADPNHCWDEGICAVHLAASRKDPMWLSLALRHKGNPNATGICKINTLNLLTLKKGEPTPPPIFCLCESDAHRHDGEIANASALIAAGADLEMKNLGGLRPFEYYITLGKLNTAYLLLTSGTSLTDANLDSIKSAIHGWHTIDKKTMTHRSRFEVEQIIAFLEVNGVDTSSIKPPQ